MSARSPRPAAWLERLAQRTFDEGTFDRVIEPALADLRHECRPPRLDQKVAGTFPGKEAATFSWTRFRAYWALAKVLVVCLLRTVASDGALHVGGVARRTAIQWLILSVVLALPPFWSEIPRLFARFGTATTAIVTALLLPQALTLSLPLALLIAAALTGRGTAIAMGRMMSGVLVASIACTLLMFAFATIVIPVANDAYISVLSTALGSPVRAGHPTMNPVLLTLCLAPMVLGVPVFLCVNTIARWRQRWSM